MKGLLALWRDIGREHDAEFQTSLKDRLQDALLGSFAIVVIAIDVAIVLAGAPS